MLERYEGHIVKKLKKKETIKRVKVLFIGGFMILQGSNNVEWIFYSIRFHIRLSIRKDAGFYLAFCSLRESCITDR